MSLKNSYTTSDCLQWDSATNLVRKLYRDKNYRISLLVGCGIFFGLRISDLLQLTWEMLLSNDAKFTITEKKTSKRREVRINKEFQKHIKDCYTALDLQNLTEFCFLSGKGKNKVYSIQWINIVHKEQKNKRQHAEDQVALFTTPAVHFAACTPVGGHGIRQGRVDGQVADHIHHTNRQQHPKQGA